MTDRIVTAALGFPLTLSIAVCEMDGAGRHTTYETPEGEVTAEHRIDIARGLEPGELVNACAHEAYHLFYSIRALITADEETQAEVFGNLVRRLVAVGGTP